MAAQRSSWSMSGSTGGRWIDGRHFQIVARGRNSTSDNHCAINRSIGVQRHGVNQFLASRNIPRHIQANWFALFVKAIFVIAVWVESMWLAGYWPADHLDVLDHALHANSALVDRVDFATPLSLSSRSVTSLSALAPAQRAGAQRLCALASNG